MKIVSALAAASAALALSAAAHADSLRVAQAPYMPPPPSLSAPASPGMAVLPETGPGTPTYESSGNAKTPRALNSPDVPAYQQGSGQETGGPARELIPKR